jgi:hypothetical protein
MYGQLQKSRHVAFKSTKFRDHKGNNADVGATIHSLRVLVKLGFLSTPFSGFMRRGWLDAHSKHDHIATSRAGLFSSLEYRDSARHPHPQGGRP